MAKSATQLMDENSVGGQIKSWPQRTKSFYTDVRTEMKKVSTPSMKEVQATTIVVLIAVALFGVFFWVTDMFLTWGVNRIMTYFK
jgi:preprotein translocase subunit SecE